MDEETRKKLEEWNREVGERPLGKKRASETQGETKKPKEQNEKPAQTESPPEETSQQKRPSLQEALEKDIAGSIPQAKKGPSPLEEARKREAEKNSQLLSRIRTYESDAADAVKRKKASVSSMVMAEQERGEKERRESQSGQETARRVSKGTLFVILSIVLIAGGIGALYGWYNFVYLPESATVMNDQPDTLVSANSVARFVFAGEGRTSLVDALESLKTDPPVSPGEIYAINFVVEEETEEGEVVERDLSSRVFLEALQVNAPISLYRSISPEFTYGVHSRQEINSAFLIFKTSFFENAFASMLSWESSIRTDLPFLVEEIPQEEVVTPNIDETTATSTENATTTENEALPEESQPDARDLTFRDEVINNQDVRILRDSAGNVRLLYSFPNQETLIIAGSIETFEEILRRLNLVEFQ